MSDFVVFVTLAEGAKFNTTFIENVFGHVDVTVHVRSNPGYNEGAILAMAEALEQGWFSSYDWVIRVNPDVLIRDDSFLLRSLHNDSIDGIFADCRDVPCPAGRGCANRLIHTDFFAVRPGAIPRDAFAGAQSQNAEVMASKVFSSIVAEQRDYWVPGAGPHRAMCRIGGPASPVIHTHDFDVVYPACLSWYS